MKANLFDINNKKDDQLMDEIRMTPQQRLNLAFQLMDLAIQLSPDKRLKPFDEGNIKWIELKFK